MTYCKKNAKCSTIMVHAFTSLGRLTYFQSPYSASSIWIEFMPHYRRPLYSILIGRSAMGSPIVLNTFTNLKPNHFEGTTGATKETRIGLHTSL